MENTPETRESIGRYTIGQLEGLLDAVNANHKDDGGSSNGEHLEDEDALRYLLSNQGKV